MVLQRGYTRPFSREKQTRTPCSSPCGWFVVLGSKLLHVSIRVCLTEDGTHLKGCVPVFFFPVAIQLIAGPHPSSIPEGTVSDAGTVFDLCAYNTTATTTTTTTSTTFSTLIAFKL